MRVATLFVLGACSAAPDPVPAALQKFTEVAQFLAPGFESYSFAIDEEPDFTSEVEHHLHVVIARSGSDFQKPKDLGVGRCRGVEVRDYGMVRVPKPWWEAGEPTTHIDGVPVWLGKGDAYAFDREEPLWTAIVDARFHVRSPDRDQLEAALRRTGRLEEIVRPFSPVALVPADAVRILCLLPRPEDSAYWSRPIPIEPMVIVLCPERRTLWFHHMPLPPGFLGHQHVVATRTVDGWTVDEAVFPELDPAWTTATWAHLFGLATFI